MTTVHLARHGETIWHDGNRYAGRSDVPLTLRGLEQADELAAWAVGARLDRVVASPLQRAQATAATVTDAVGLALDTDDRLVEVDFGKGDGLTSAEMDERFADARRAFVAHPASSPLPGGEPGAAVVARSLAALRDLVAATPDGTVLVVAHTTLIRLTLCALLGLPLDEYRRTFPRLDNVAVTTLTLDPALRASLIRYNVPPLSLRPPAPPSLSAT